MTSQDVYCGAREICNAYQANKNFPKIDTNSPEVMAEMIDIFMKKVHCNELSEPDPPTFKDTSRRFD